MRKLFLFALLLIATPFGARSQSMVVEPNSGVQGQSLSVTIVGFVTKFRHTANVSSIDAELQRSGQIYAQIDQPYLVNDSTIKGDLQIPANIAIGWYDLVVHTHDSAYNTFTQASAFYVGSGSPQIKYTNPTSSYDSVTEWIYFTGQNTNFLNGTKPTMYFVQNGTTYFSKVADSVFSALTLGGRVTIPANAPAGLYDVIATNNMFSDTGLQKFEVLGPAPSVVIVPDSGMSGTSFDVSVVGQGTDFFPTTGVSSPYTLNVSLLQNGSLIYHTTADTVFSATRAHVVFTLDSTIQPGLYDAEIFGYSSQSSYDLYTTFLVTAHHKAIRIPFHFSAKPADTITIGVTGTGVNFIYNGNKFDTVQLVKGNYVLTAQTVNVQSQTSLSAFFAIPSNAPAGLYDVKIVEPGTGKIDIGQSQFSVLGSYVDTGYHMSPDAGAIGQLVDVTIQGAFPVEDSPTAIWLQNGQSVITGTITSHSPFSVTFQIPDNAQTGNYDLEMALSGLATGDTIVTPNVFSVVVMAGVSDNALSSSLINSLHVSPNPTQKNASISFVMSATSHVRLVIFDAMGKTIATLCDRLIGSGAQNFDWSVADVPSGNYFYQITAEETISTGRIVVQH